MTDYDVLILGAGPAGLTAQLYALRYNLKVLTIGGIVGGLMTESHKICNWPGEAAITGQELTRRMREQVAAAGGEIIVDEAATVNQLPDGFKVNTKNGKSFTARRILIAVGTAHRKLGVAGEEALAGRGVAYCATCDAMFFKGKTVAVVGGGNSAMTAALYLADICPTVYLIYRDSELTGEVSWFNEVMKRENIIKIKETNIKELVGQEKLEKIVLDKPHEGASELAVSGLFVEIGTKPKTELFITLGGEVDERGYIKVNADQSTNLPNVWAAGDITDGSNGFRQILTACSEAAIAADSIFKSLQGDKT